ncbi:unnamed protein product [Mytilus coruscus]|uniref:G-protein coupled receptors family 1 profile domain-containing protein n=1 Tax=Mytilus coruscus TaxID=42192 RepID=A0A6J8AU83_MYTCO|nr:unnamed protein product [Mytilus coruscus]
MALIISNVTVSTSSQNLTNVTVNATKSEYNNTTARDSIQNPDNTYLLEDNGYISFILTSTSIFICLLVIIFAFKKNGKEYFKWKKSQRFIVVTAACDIMFYGVQLAFATDVTISGIVPSSSICSIYAVVLLEVAYAQCNLSMIIATTACFCILQQENLNFGKYDWKMFLCMFSYQAIILVIAAFNGGTDFNGI